MFAVYTVSRQYGSEGGKLAQLLAERCSYQLLWRELINQAAIKIGQPEMALAVIDELGLLGISPDEDTWNTYREALQRVITAKASMGKVVIVGRASQIILKGFPNCLHLRVIASLDTRISNVQNSKNVSKIAAKAQIEESDRNRQKFIQKMYAVEWNDPSLYDLTINTDHLGLDKIAYWLGSL